ncbi:hypothetical protein HCTV5_154 [Halovirus HCTV-5]|uniref:membrane protein n=1 Tax=Halovirus HCTV-5 TaxID=1273748 RepID=UPI0003348893|nr:membrane protein [Halovirus HCTV-5]AGM11758.1 hypothetical protein HCTV5_154 [Halovirus HCTV-5]
MTTGLLLLAAHLLGDFPLQPRWMAREKIDDVGVRFVHVVIHALLVVTFLELSGVGPGIPSPFYGAYTASHFLIDSRRWVEPRDDFPTWQYVVDQILHVTAIAWCSVLFL